MSYALLVPHVLENNGFTRNPDPSGWLAVLNWVYNQPEPEVVKIKNMSIDLVKFLDNPGFYEISGGLPEGVSVTMNPLPFVANSDGEAENGLKTLLDRFNFQSIVRLNFGKIREVKYGSDLLTRLNSAPERAKEIWADNYKNCSMC